MLFKRACLLHAGVCQAVLWGRNIQPNQTLISMINYYDKTQLLKIKKFPLPPMVGRLAGRWLKWVISQVLVDRSKKLSFSLKNIEL